MLVLTMQEVGERVFSAKMWKALDEDGLPAAVWANVWPAVQYRVFLLFQNSFLAAMSCAGWGQVHTRQILG